MKLASIWRGPYTVVEKVGKVNFKLKDQDGKIAETLAHASDLMVVNGERPQLNIIRTKAYLRRFEPWNKEQMQGFEARARKLKVD